MDKFFELVRDQYSYGGVKYANSTEKEATDILCEDFGMNWLLGTCGKYCKRFKNTSREKDLLKMGCYQYIIWLKRGFHLSATGSNDIINTNVEIKNKYFDTFINNYKTFPHKSFVAKDIDIVYLFYSKLAAKPFIEISENELFYILNLLELLWVGKFKDLKEHETDTWNDVIQKTDKLIVSALGIPDIVCSNDGMAK